MCRSGSPIRSMVLIAVAVGCGSDGTGSGPPADQDPLIIQRAPTNSGNGQTGTVGEVLGSGLRIVITRASEPQSGVDVAWATADGGSLAPPGSATDADGVAMTTWTLGPSAGTQTATAAANGAEGSPVSFTATAEDDAPPPPPTPPPPPPPPAAATIQMVGTPRG
jgi:hypothetical protein